ncbi:hypothetical protein CNMCM6936_004852 [Aspergillus lentulus]|nr:hypothetical protein CNMCM6936_004852 [Aspergillus lentulus]
MPPLQVSFMFGMGLIVGKLYDIFGPRYLILIGSFLHVFGLMMASLATKYYQLLLSQGICSVIGVAAIFQPAMGCILGWFSRRRGAAERGVCVDDAHRGVCDPGVTGDCEFDGPRTRDEGGQADESAEFGEAVRRGKDGASGAGVYVFDYLVAIINAGSLLGRLSAGVCSDRVGGNNILVCVVFQAGVVVLGLWFPAAGNAAIIVFAVVFGFTTGIYVSFAPVLMVAISPLEEIGYRMGLIFLFASVGGLTTSPIGGAILQRNGGSYTRMKLFSGVMLLVGAGFMVAARVVQTGWVLKAKF